MHFLTGIGITQKESIMELSNRCILTISLEAEIALLRESMEQETPQNDQKKQEYTTSIYNTLVNQIFDQMKTQPEEKFCQSLQSVKQLVTKIPETELFLQKEGIGSICKKMLLLSDACQYAFNNRSTISKGVLAWLDPERFLAHNEDSYEKEDLNFEQFCIKFMEQNETDVTEAGYCLRYLLENFSEILRKSGQTKEDFQKFNLLSFSYDWLYRSEDIQNNLLPFFTNKNVEDMGFQEVIPSLLIAAWGYFLIFGSIDKEEEERVQYDSIDKVLYETYGNRGIGFLLYIVKKYRLENPSLTKEKMIKIMTQSCIAAIDVRLHALKYDESAQKRRNQVKVEIKKILNNLYDAIEKVNPSKRERESDVSRSDKKRKISQNS